MTQPYALTSPGAFDTLLMFRTTGDGSLDTTGTYNGVAIYKTPADGLTIKANVPDAEGTSPLLTLIIQAADTDADGSYAEVARFEGISSVGVYAIRVATQRAYLRLSAEVAGTTPDFGAVQVGAVGHGY